jgi:diguanylate cyclase
MSERIEQGLRATGAETQIAQRIEKLRGEFPGNPLLPEVEWLAGQYVRLQQRFDKITAISDRLQAQVLEMNRVLQEQVISDPLTGLMNRPGLLERLYAECARLAREHTPFGLLMLDIDHFKAINDAYGHHVGDQVLVDVAAALRSHMRPYDVFSRWGGEEFLLLLPAVAMETLAELAERLRVAVHGVSVQGVEQAPPVRVSIGLYLCSIEEDPAESVRKADSALYLAKKGGRDRVAVYMPA